MRGEDGCNTSPVSSGNCLGDDKFFRKEEGHSLAATNEI